MTILVTVFTGLIVCLISERDPRNAAVNVSVDFYANVLTKSWVYRTKMSSKYNSADPAFLLLMLVRSLKRDPRRNQERAAGWTVPRQNSDCRRI